MFLYSRGIDEITRGNAQIGKEKTWDYDEECSNISKADLSPLTCGIFS